MLLPRSSAVKAVILSLALAIPFACADDSLPKLSDTERETLASSLAQELPHLDQLDIDLWMLSAGPIIQRFNSNEDEQRQIMAQVLRMSHAYDIPTDLVLAVIEIESHFDRYAISHAGALGLMQIMPFWIDEIGQPDDNLMTIDTNIRYGCAILRYYLDRNHGSWHLALAGYNGSTGRTVYSKKVLDAWDQRWRFTRVTATED
jgi:soluble lytic murein transglycosylase-like protein